MPSGLTHADYTFNAMVGLHHRQPRTVGAVLTCDGITAEVIADNMHLHIRGGKTLGARQRGKQKRIGDRRHSDPTSV